MTVILVVLIKDGPSSGKIAVIAEIIDHNRVGPYPYARGLSLTFYVQAIIDGPTTGVPRQPIAFRYVTLTPLLVKALPRAARSGVVKKYVEKEGIVEKWEKSSWAQRRAAIEKRRKLNDFDRFQVMLQKKARRDRVRKVLKGSKS